MANVQEKVAEVLAENLDIDAATIKPESTFEELGLDSLDTVDLLMTLEDEFGVTVEPNEELTTVGAVVAEIEKLKA